MAILFAAAFLLLLLAYFMQQRNFSGLQDSVNSFQSVETLLDVNKRLTEENAALKEQVEDLADETEALQQQVIDRQDDARLSSQSVEAMDWLWRIQRSYSRGNRSEAKRLAQGFEESGLTTRLPEATDAFPDGPSPAEQYDALLSVLGMQKATP